MDSESICQLALRRLKYYDLDMSNRKIPPCNVSRPSRRFKILACKCTGTGKNTVPPKKLKTLDMHLYIQTVSKPQKKGLFELPTLLSLVNLLLFRLSLGS